MLKPQVVRILGTPIALIDEVSFLETIARWLARKDELTPGAFVCFADVHGVIQALDDPALRLAYEESFMNAPDGMPIVWLTRHRSGATIKRVCGPDILPAVCNVSLSKSWRHVFLGGSPATLDALIVSLKSRFPDIVIADAISPPFRSLSAEETEKLLDRIRSAKPDLIWVGLGCPKQELWMSQYAHGIRGAISMGVGAAFDFHAGKTRRAPIWLRKTGFEWFYRVIQEPKRLRRRYLSIVPRFLLRVAIEEVKLRARLRGSRCRL